MNKIIPLHRKGALLVILCLMFSVNFPNSQGRVMPGNPTKRLASAPSPARSAPPVFAHTAATSVDTVTQVDVLPDEAVEITVVAPPALEPLQSGGNYNITQSVIPGGGGVSGNDNTSVTGSVGQNITATSSGGQYTINGGFWGGAGCQAIVLSPATLPNGQLGAAYNQPLTASGGTAPYNFTVSSGVLPNNLTLSTAGLLAGTATQSGSFNFTITATDANACTSSLSYTLVIGNCPALTITPATLPNGTVGTAYNQVLTPNGGTPPYNFSVSAGALPGGLTLSAGGVLSGTPTSASTFNFTVQAADTNGCAGTQAYTVIISGNSGGAGLLFYPLARPVRLLDTRANQGNCDQVSTPVVAGTSLTTQARINCEGIPIPASAQAIVGNITVINGSAQAGFLTLYPAGQSLPLAANMIYQPGQLLSNAFTVGLNANGEFNIYGERTIDVVVDVSGYFAPPGAGGLYYHALPRPLRLLDTRANQGNCDSVGAPIAAGTSLTTQARVTCEGLTIPAAAQAIVGTGTVINRSAQAGFLTFYPAGQPLPLAANMIYQPGQLLSNAFTVGLSADGSFSIFGERTIDMVVDVAGYYSAEASDANGPGLLFNPLSRPIRLLDTRPNQGNCDNISTPITAGTSLTTQARITCEGILIPTSAQAVLGNITVINASAQVGFLTLFPAEQSLPLAANMIYQPGQLLSNAFAVGLSGAGEFNVFGERTIDVVVDVSGYFAP